MNFTKLALRYSEGLRKDEVAGALKRVVAKLGELLASGADVEVQLAHVARLFGRGRRVLEREWQLLGGMHQVRQGDRRARHPEAHGILVRRQASYDPD